GTLGKYGLSEFRYAFAARNRQFEFQKCSQLFISSHNETLSVGVALYDEETTNPFVASAFYVESNLMRLREFQEYDYKDPREWLVAMQEIESIVSKRRL